MILPAAVPHIRNALSPLPTSKSRRAKACILPSDARSVRCGREHGSETIAGGRRRAAKRSRSSTDRWGQLNLPVVSLSGSRVPTGFDSTFAEREGFEPSVQLPVHLISSQAPSTTRSPLQV